MSDIENEVALRKIVELVDSAIVFPYPLPSTLLSPITKAPETSATTLLKSLGVDFEAGYKDIDVLFRGPHQLPLVHHYDGWWESMGSTEKNLKKVEPTEEELQSYGRDNGVTLMVYKLFDEFLLREFSYEEIRSLSKAIASSRRVIAWIYARSANHVVVMGGSRVTVRPKPPIKPPVAKKTILGKGKEVVKQAMRNICRSQRSNEDN
ncbi:hypothetical protein BC938DRAFT_483276 [Jimgerdemannia flammicorona]|uniref:Uncharacterized protein n=1 Tax=Jimgerdemannia flammicorona TaxID=994334 RepID=A0A433QCA7_9FUNG|nr:hypothetical protein BC938DRAFT_483276 [Jimgerdemannia flammicorona]